MTRLGTKTVQSSGNSRCNYMQSNINGPTIVPLSNSQRRIQDFLMGKGRISTERRQFEADGGAPLMLIEAPLSLLGRL